MLRILTFLLVCIMLFFTGCGVKYKGVDNGVSFDKGLYLETNIDALMTTYERYKNAGCDEVKRLYMGLLTKPEKECPKPVVNPEDKYPQAEDGVIYNTKYHHTRTTSDRKVLVLCPGQEKLFERCYVGMIPIPYKGDPDGTGRHTWWKMDGGASGNIRCQDKQKRIHEFKATGEGQNGVDYGSCN